MNTIVAWLSGRKTNLTAAAIVTLSITALVNGWGEAELAALGIAVGTIGATLRAALSKPVVLTVIAVGVLSFAGCAGLSKVNPDTGKTYGQEAQEQVVEFSAILPPPFNMIIPAVTGLLLFGGAALAKAGEDEPTG